MAGDRIFFSLKLTLVILNILTREKESNNFVIRLRLMVQQTVVLAD